MASSRMPTSPQGSLQIEAAGRSARVRHQAERGAPRGAAQAGPGRAGRGRALRWTRLALAAPVRPAPPPLRDRRCRQPRAMPAVHQLAMGRRRTSSAFAAPRSHAGLAPVTHRADRHKSDRLRGTSLAPATPGPAPAAPSAQCAAPLSGAQGGRPSRRRRGGRRRGSLGRPRRPAVPGRADARRGPRHARRRDPGARPRAGPAAGRGRAAGAHPRYMSCSREMSGADTGSDTAPAGRYPCRRKPGSTWRAGRVRTPVLWLVLA